MRMAMPKSMPCRRELAWRVLRRAGGPNVRESMQCSQLGAKGPMTRSVPDRDTDSIEPLTGRRLKCDACF
jgi:hypothetical protein